jgi:hypothetical protein
MEKFVKACQWLDKNKWLLFGVYCLIAAYGADKDNNHLAMWANLILAFIAIKD